MDEAFSHGRDTVVRCWVMTLLPRSVLIAVGPMSDCVDAALISHPPARRSARLNVDMAGPPSPQFSFFALQAEASSPGARRASCGRYVIAFCMAPRSVTREPLHKAARWRQEGAGPGGAGVEATGAGTPAARSCLCLKFDRIRRMTPRSDMTMLSVWPVPSSI